MSASASGYSEDALVEQPAIALFAELGWETLNAYQEANGPGGLLGREARAEVVLEQRLRPALVRLNPTLSAEALDQAIAELTRDRGTVSPSAANREVYQLLKDGVRVTIPDERGGRTVATARVIDWRNPAANDFLLVSQLWVSGHQRTMAERLRAILNAKLSTMVRANRSRIDFQERFEALIAEYNTGAMNVQAFFDELVSLARSLSDEDRRAVGEQLTEEELAIFDLLTRPEPDLTEAETKVVKQAARDLLATLKAETLALDWRKQQRTRQAVRVCIEQVYDRELPTRYDKVLFDTKVEATFRHVYEAYFGEGRSIYTEAA